MADVKAKWTYWQLVDDETGQNIELGTILRDFASQEWIYCGATPPRHGHNATKGMVHVQRRNTFDNLEAVDFFPSVLNTHFEKREVQRP